MKNYLAAASPPETFRLHRRAKNRDRLWVRVAVQRDVAVDPVDFVGRIASRVGGDLSLHFLGGD